MSGDSQTATRAAVRSFLLLAKGGEELKDWAVQVKRDSDGKGLFGMMLPLGQRAAAIEAKMVAVIEQDWRASGRKESRSYTLSLLNAQQIIKGQECITCEPEPVTAADIASQSMQVTLSAMASAAEAMVTPFEQTKEIITLQRTEIIDGQRAQIEDLKGELTEARARIKTLESEAQLKTDELRNHRGKYAEAELLTAQAEKAKSEGQAALVVANAEAKAFNEVTGAALKAFPSLAGIAVKALGGGKLGSAVEEALGGKNPNAGPDAKAKRAKLIAVIKETKAFPPELAAKVRAIALSDVEVARLLRYFWVLDPEVDALELLDSGAAFFTLAPELHAHFTGK